MGAVRQRGRRRFRAHSTRPAAHGRCRQQHGHHARADQARRRRSDRHRCPGPAALDERRARRLRLADHRPEHRLDPVVGQTQRGGAPANGRDQHRTRAGSGHPHGVARPVRRRSGLRIPTDGAHPAPVLHPGIQRSVRIADRRVPAAPELHRGHLRRRGGGVLQSPRLQRESHPGRVPVRARSAAGLPGQDPMGVQRRCADAPALWPARGPVRLVDRSDHERIDLTEQCRVRCAPSAVLPALLQSARADPRRPGDRVVAWPRVRSHLLPGPTHLPRDAVRGGHLQHAAGTRSAALSRPRPINGCRSGRRNGCLPVRRRPFDGRRRQLPVAGGRDRPDRPAHRGPAAQRDAQRRTGRDPQGPAGLLAASAPDACGAIPQTRSQQDLRLWR